MLTIIKEHSRNGKLAGHPDAGLLRGGLWGDKEDRMMTPPWSPNADPRRFVFLTDGRFRFRSVSVPFGRLPVHARVRGLENNELRANFFKEINYGQIN